MALKWNRAGGYRVDIKMVSIVNRSGGAKLAKWGHRNVLAQTAHHVHGVGPVGGRGARRPVRPRGGRQACRRDRHHLRRGGFGLICRTGQGRTDLPGLRQALSQCDFHGAHPRERPPQVRNTRKDRAGKANLRHRPGPALPGKAADHPERPEAADRQIRGTRLLTKADSSCPALCRASTS
jgi:hypothetical protein